jgi:hypothetical protein
MFGKWNENKKWNIIVRDKNGIVLEEYVKGKLKK